MAKNIAPSIGLDNYLNYIIAYIENNQIDGNTFSNLYSCKLEDQSKMDQLCDAVKYYPMWSSNITSFNNCNLNNIMYLNKIIDKLKLVKLRNRKWYFQSAISTTCDG
eukprot:411847_1